MRSGSSDCANVVAVVRLQHFLFQIFKKQNDCESELESVLIFLKHVQRCLVVDQFKILFDSRKLNKVFTP